MSGLAVVVIAVPGAAVLAWGLPWIATGAGSLAWHIEEWRNGR